MTSRLFRWALLGATLGLVTAWVPGCAKKCGPETCGSGCCNQQNECVTNVNAAACGANGGMCSMCGADQFCQNGFCQTANTNTDGGADGGFDAGPPPCKNDFDCQPLMNGSICDTSSGQCLVGLGCGDDSDCQSLDSDNRCYSGGQQCVCDYRDKPANSSGTGTCRLRKSPCQECTLDRECGDNAVIFGYPGLGEGKCQALMGDTSGKKYCRYRRIGQCACGTVDDGTGYCRPQSNSCDSVGCNLDKDCPSGFVCTVNQPDAGASSCGGLCVARCRWDFNAKNLVAPGCPQGQTCWVDSANLDPTSIYYGSGRCKPPCQNDTECKLGPGNAFGGDNLKCASEDLGGGARSDNRCRANGECMDTVECPDQPNDQPYLGYCDRGTFQCKTDCRPEQDPVTGLPYRDCRPPYSCAVDAGMNVCRLQTCVEQGGAGIACAQGQYCCGEDKNGDGQADPCPPLAERDEAGCYKAPAPPFCTTCMADSECLTPASPAWLTPCANGSKSPNCSLLPPKCMYAGDRPEGGMGVNICMPATWNDITKIGGRVKADLGCPVNYSEEAIRPDLSNGEDFCDTDDDCNVGTDAGACEPDPGLRLNDGGLLKSCRCTAGSPGTTNRAQCPNDPDAGLVTECRSGTSGTRQACIETVVCSPSTGAAYLPVEGFGCGL